MRKYLCVMIIVIAVANCFTDELFADGTLSYEDLYCPDFTDIKQNCDRVIIHVEWGAECELEAGLTYGVINFYYDSEGNYKRRWVYHPTVITDEMVDVRQWKIVDVAPIFDVVNSYYMYYYKDITSSSYELSDKYRSWESAVIDLNGREVEYCQEDACGCSMTSSSKRNGNAGIEILGFLLTLLMILVGVFSLKRSTVVK